MLVHKIEGKAVLVAGKRKLRIYIYIYIYVACQVFDSIDNSVFSYICLFV